MSRESEGASGESIEEMLQHLDEAKKLQKTSSTRSSGGGASTKLQREILRRADPAVLASNHEARLSELASKNTVTHRSGKPWKSAKIGVEAHGCLPIYYRLDGEVTHKGYISRILLHPNENTVAADEFVQHITDDDDYSEYHEQLDTTTFLVTDGERLSDPFPQTELQKLSGDGPIDEGYSRQPAYVVQRPGDFPDFS